MKQNGFVPLRMESVRMLRKQRVVSSQQPTTETLLDQSLLERQVVSPNTQSRDTMYGKQFRMNSS